MTRLLTWLTYLLLGAVVGVLASHLVLVARALLRANRNLARIADGLEAIRDNTAALERSLTTINGAAAALHDGLRSVETHLGNVGRMVTPRTGA